jgi:hypothetical protein
MHHAGAARAEPPKAAELGPVGPELHLVKCRTLRLFASQAVEPSRPARTFTCSGSPLEKFDQVQAPDDRGVAIPDGLETGLEPVAHGAGRGPCYLGGFPDVVGAQPLDPLGRMSSVRHP